MIRHKKVLLLIPLLLVAVLTVIFFLKVRNSEKPIAFETATVKKGSIAQTISATGTVEPVDKVEVGTQVSGVVKKIYVDFNSTVTKGQLLAELDKITLQATLDLNKVTLRSAQIECEFLKQKFERTSKLFEKGMVSQQEIDQATYEYERAKNNEKALAEVKSSGTQSQLCHYHSPINGIVLSRSSMKARPWCQSQCSHTVYNRSDMLRWKYMLLWMRPISGRKAGQRLSLPLMLFRKTLSMEMSLRSGSNR